MLRIEDTDRKRIILDAQSRICRDLDWAGLQWDEGPEVSGPFEPYEQSARTPLYQKHAKDLLVSGHAYRCFCTAERLNELATRRHNLGLPTDYDRKCVGISAEESDERAHKGERHTIRLMVPERYPQVTDLIYGVIGGGKDRGFKFMHGEACYEDPILIKSDGLPTYHMANVVDDHYMEITHVIRGVEWISSTPRHLALYTAFGWKPPAFAHPGLLMDDQGRKLSKRNLDTDISSFRDKGILPEALINHVALLGWSHSRKDDFHTLQDLVENFDLKFTKGNTVVSFQKLDFLQRRHAERAIEAKNQTWGKIVNDVLREFQRRDEWKILNSDLCEKEYIAAILEGDKQNYITPSIFLDRNLHFFHHYTWPSDASPFATLSNFPYHAAYYSAVKKIFGDLQTADWTLETVRAQIFKVVHGIECETSNNPRDINVQLMRWLRCAVIKGASGPPMAEAIYILGKDVVMARIDEAFGAHNASAGESEDRQNL